jgi:hypothetical protein
MESAQSRRRRISTSDFAAHGYVGLCQRPRRRATPPDDDEDAVMEYNESTGVVDLMAVSKWGKWGFWVGTNGGGNRKWEVTVALPRNAAEISPLSSILCRALPRMTLSIFVMFRHDPEKTADSNVSSRPASELLHPF